LTKTAFTVALLSYSHLKYLSQKRFSNNNAY
jgi:hypothetical protein